MNRALLLAIVLVLPLVPAGATGDDSVTIPIGRAGDVATYRHAYSFGPPNPFSGALNYTISTGDIEEVKDGFGRVRLAYPITRSTEFDDPRRVWVEANTGTIVRADGPFGIDRSDTFRASEVLPVMPPLDARRDVTDGQDSAWYGFNPGDTAPLEGRTLRAGETFTWTGPAWTASYHARGWSETSEGRLFRVDAVTHGVDGDWEWESYWFDGMLPIPRVVSSPSSWTDYAYTNSLLSFSAGSGPAHVEPTYVPPPFTSTLGRVALGRDGPVEQLGIRLELSEAARAARSDPRTAAFFATHPAAFVWRGAYEESIPRWTLQYGDGPARLDVEVRGAGPVAFVASMNLSEVTTWALTPFDDLRYDDLSCFGEARALAAETGPIDGIAKADFYVLPAGSLGFREDDVFCRVTAAIVAPPGATRRSGTIETWINGFPGMRELANSVWRDETISVDGP